MHERLEPVNGFVRVPEKPGLGLTLDRQALARLKALELPQQPRWIIVSSFANGTEMFCPYDPAHTGHFMVRPDWKPGLAPFSFCAPITTRYWDDDGGADFEAMYATLEREGMILRAP